MNIEKTHERFWEAMRARFGKRWLDEFGAEPSAPWIQLLKPYTPPQLRKALELMGEQKLAHPPTLPQFDSLLKRAASKSPDDGIDHVRAYWRSVAVADCLRCAALVNLVEYGETRLGKLPVDVYPLAVRLCGELVDWACSEERKREDRTPDLGSHINATLWNALKPFARSGTHDISHLSTVSVPRGTTQHNLEGQT